MTYRSVYTEQYQRADESGRAYDETTGNRFELAIYELERRVLRDVFARLFHSDPKVRYLDFACGTGRVLTVFRDLVHARMGIDTSPTQLAMARQKDPEAVLVCGNLVTNPELLGGRQFDLVTCFRLLLHLEPEYRVPVLAALRERLAPNGRVIVNNHMNRYSLLGMAAFCAHKILRIPRKPFVPPGKRGISATMTEAEMRRVVRSAGLEVEEVHRLFVLPGHGPAVALPTRWLVPLEAALSRVPGVRRLSKDQIFVCRVARGRGA